MKLNYFFILLFFVIYPAYPQQDSIKTYQIDYQRTINNPRNNSTHTKVYMTHLIPSKGISYYDENEKVRKSNSETLKITGNTAEWKPNGKNLSVVYKDYRRNEMYLKQNIQFKFLVVKDSLGIFDWEIQNSEKTILGINCQNAKMVFRGRSYEAWFATELPAGGPWKFDGLPGLILEIRSLDDYIKFEAVAIRAKNIPSEDSLLDNPFSKDSFLTWQKFKQVYKNKAIEVSKFNTSDGDSYGKVTPRMTIERYIEEDDSDYTADKELERLFNNKMK